MVAFVVNGSPKKITYDGYLKKFGLVFKKVNCYNHILNVKYWTSTELFKWKKLKIYHTLRIKTKTHVSINGDWI